MSSSDEAPWTLPKTWEWTTAGDVAQVIGGGTPDTKDAENFGGVIPWVTPADMSTHVGKTIAGGSRSLTKKGLAGSGAKWMPEGTVLFSSRAPIGYTAIASKPVTTNQGFKSFVPESCITSDYLYHWLASSKERAEKLASGTTFLEISGAKAALIPVPVAPLAEQTRIVEKLEELLSDLDAGVAELKAAQRRLAQYRQSLLKAAVEGALTADWRAAHGKPQESGAELLQRILSERRTRWEQKQLTKFAEQGKTPPKGWQAKYVEPVAPPSNNELSIPGAWVWTGIEQLADGTPHALKAGPFGSALKKEFYTPTGYKVYGQEQVIRGDAYFGDYFISASKYQELISCATKAGDLLISLVGTTGKILVLPRDAQPGIINPRLLKLSLSPGNVSPEYVRVVLESPYARHFFKLNAHGGTMDVLNLGILKELAIPLPELPEQEEIVRKVNEEFESIERQESAIRHALKQSSAQRKNLLKAAFSGQLVSQNPNDEPASHLLARIRAERASNDGSAPRRPRKIA